MTVSVRFIGSGDSFGSGGRFQTCILVDAPDFRFTMDFGASSLVGLAKQGISHNTIDAIFLTHLHGDHCGGVSFMLLDAMLGARRDRPLIVAGPRDVQARIEAINEALFPGMNGMTPRFPLEFRELAVGAAQEVHGAIVTPRPARHTEGTNPTALRIEVGGKIVAYTGDGEFTDEMAQIGQDADLLICECYYHSKPVKWHLNYYTIAERAADFGAKRMVLTHMSDEMLARVDEVPEECAYDGMVIAL